MFGSQPMEPAGSAAAGRELLDLMENHGGHSEGRSLRREDAYDGRV
jgi:hypothetical protein